jgi:HEAT repeat protein
MLTKVRGVPAERLVEVLRGHGGLERAVLDLGHRSPVRRAQAAQLLGLARAENALRRLVAALNDEVGEVRNSAAYGLGLVGDPAGARAILTALGKPGRGLPASTAAEALQAMGVGVAEALRESLGDPNARTRTVAAYLTGQRSFTRALPELRHLLDTDPDLTVRETVAVAIGRLGRAEDVAVLARHTTIDDPITLRRACAAALGELGETDAVPALVELLDDPDPRLAEIAATSLIQLGPSGRDLLGAHGHNPAVRAAQVVAALQGAGA